MSATLLGSTQFSPDGEFYPTLAKRGKMIGPQIVTSDQKNFFFNL